MPRKQIMGELALQRCKCEFAFFVTWQDERNERVAQRALTVIKKNVRKTQMRKPAKNLSTLKQKPSSHIAAKLLLGLNRTRLSIGNLLQHNVKYSRHENQPPQVGTRAVKFAKYSQLNLLQVNRPCYRLASTY
jgi:endonuclease/exonuclease/phosphatase (EEP) superfamily protein YafD